MYTLITDRKITVIYQPALSYRKAGFTAQKLLKLLLLFKFRQVIN